VPARNKSTSTASVQADTPIRTSLSPHSGDRRDVEDLRRDAWQDFGAVTIPYDDARLQPAEAGALYAIGVRLFGARLPKAKPL
jgi:hypothetical protein